MSFPLLSTRVRSPAVDIRPFCEASVRNESKENIILLFIIEILYVQNGNMVLHTSTHTHTHKQ